mmetsp:Transcript_13996/g.33274  ORF Transcript_13996/g.33274 Transcript_13996/m.33274 type:complete len:243 (-) Transcript_13996:1543-2271(-)
MLLTSAESRVEPFLVLLAEPHVALGIQVLVLHLEALHFLYDGVVHQMHVLTPVGQRLIILLTRKPQVRLLPNVHGQRVPVSDQHPLANIKLVAMDKLWPLDVLLTDPLEAITFTVPKDFVQLPHHLDPSAARLAGRLHDPGIAAPVDGELPAGGVHLLKHLPHLLDKELCPQALVAGHWSTQGLLWPALLRLRFLALLLFSGSRICLLLVFLSGLLLLLPLTHGFRGHLPLVDEVMQVVSIY